MENGKVMANRHLAGLEAYQPSELYLAISSNTIPDYFLEFELVEPIGGYVRQPLLANGWTITNAVADWQQQITFGPATMAWGTMRSWAIVDQSDPGTGRLLFWGPLQFGGGPGTATFQVAAGQRPCLRRLTIIWENYAPRLSLTTANQILQYLLAVTPLPFLPLYLGLFHPATNLEFSGGGYQRTELSSALIWDEVAGELRNDQTVFFPQPTALWSNAAPALGLYRGQDQPQLFYRCHSNTGLIPHPLEQPPYLYKNTLRFQFLT